MLAKTAIQKISLAAFTLTACAAGAIATAPSSAHADTLSRPGSGVLKSTDGGATAGTFTLTFQGQTTSAAKDGGNIEYTWSVQSGRDAAMGDGINIGVGELQECTISKSMDMASTKLTQFAINGNSAAAPDRLGNFEIQHLMSAHQDADGAKGGNVEFEWKVEEGES